MTYFQVAGCTIYQLSPHPQSFLLSLIRDSHGLIVPWQVPVLLLTFPCARALSLSRFEESGCPRLGLFVLWWLRLIALDTESRNIVVEAIVLSFLRIDVEVNSHILTNQGIE